MPYPFYLITKNPWVNFIQRILKLIETYRR